MYEIASGLYVGDAQSYEDEVKGEPGWAVVHACKEPYHRQLLGYSSRAAPPNHPEYLVAQRGDRLFLNLIDPPHVALIPKVIIDRAIEFIGVELDLGRKVLVHCNRGESRGPSIGLLFLVARNVLSRETAYEDFLNLYPRYQPGIGMREYVRRSLAT